MCPSLTLGEFENVNVRCVLGMQGLEFRGSSLALGFQYWIVAWA